MSKGPIEVWSDSGQGKVQFVAEDWRECKRLLDSCEQQLLSGSVQLQRD